MNIKLDEPCKGLQWKMLQVETVEDFQSVERGGPQQAEQRHFGETLVPLRPPVRLAARVGFLVHALLYILQYKI